MKYTVGVIVAVLVIGGVIVGYSLGNDGKKSANTSATSNSQPSASAQVLDLSGRGLKTVDASVYSQTGTTDLTLSNNSIKTLPSQMGKMTNVVIFRIDHNLLEGSLIGEIRQMAKLKQLDISYNKMTGVPAEIGQLSDLETLDYSYNNISGLPNELANLKNNLRSINLTGNPLSQDKLSKLKAELPNTNIIF